MKGDSISKLVNSVTGKWAKTRKAVEKKGFWPLFEEFKIAEKYDIAIACAEGYANRAAKTLLARATTHMTLLCLHDADPYGYNIHRTLETETRACPFGVDIIDIGLKLPEALDMELQPETFHRQKALPQGLDLDETELDYFTGTRNGWGNSWQGQRVELNDLAKAPDRFIDWLEGKLQSLGLAKTLVPPTQTIKEQAAKARAELLNETVRRHVEDLIGMDEIVERLQARFESKVQLHDTPTLLNKWGKKLEPERWRNHLQGILRKRVQKIDASLNEAAIEALQESLDALGDGERE